MRAILIINGVDFTPWLRSGGLQQTAIARQGRSVVALDGTAYRAEIIKRGLSVGLIDMKDTAWRRMLEALRDRPVQARYMDDRMGEAVKTFYVVGPTAAAQAVRGGHTYFTGGSFELEEK